VDCVRVRAAGTTHLRAHIDEQDADTAAVSAGKTACIVAHYSNGTASVWVTAAELDDLAGSVPAFNELVRARLASVDK
jgi:hypothetical protein